MEDLLLFSKPALNYWTSLLTQDRSVLPRVETLKTSGIFRKPHCRYRERADSRVATACQTPRVSVSNRHLHVMMFQEAVKRLLTLSDCRFIQCCHPSTSDTSCCFFTVLYGAQPLLEGAQRWSTACMGAGLAWMLTRSIETINASTMLCPRPFLCWLRLVPIRTGTEQMGAIGYELKCTEAI